MTYVTLKSNLRFKEPIKMRQSTLVLYTLAAGFFVEFEKIQSNQGIEEFIDLYIFFIQLAMRWRGSPADRRGNCCAPWRPRPRV
jgi:hypothetical protein